MNLSRSSAVSAPSGPSPESIGQAYHTARARWLPSVSLVFWVVTLAVVAVTIATNIGETRKVANVLAGAQPGLLLAAVALEVVFIVNITLFYTSTFRAARVPARFGRFLLVTAASYFLNLVSKTGGLGGIAPYLQEARREGTPTAAASAAYLVVYVLGYVAYTAVLVAALVFLYLGGRLTTGEEAASATLIALILGAGGAIAAGLRSRTALQRLYLALVTPLNAVWRLIRRRDAIDPRVAKETAGEFYDAAVEVKRQPRRYAIPFVHALGVELLAAAMLYFVARSLHADVTPAQALSAYAIALLFSMIAITPSGVGFVELSLAALLVSFGVPKQNAIAAALGYRLFEFWLPVLLGILSFALLRALGQGRSPDEAP